MNNNLNVLPLGTVLLNGKRKYRVEEVLGTGGFGITYKVSSTVLVDHVPVNTFFAMKEYFPDACYRGNDHATMLFSSTLAADIEQSLNDFITEARRLYSFADKSEHIVKVNEVFKENGTAYYIMEYLEGGNLHEYIQQHGALSEREAVSILTPIAKAVESLHADRILHLDIKPENIMLKKDHQSGQTRPVLIDFGLVKHFDIKGKPTTRLAAKGASDGYAPMEQYTTIDSFAPTLDVYALGATLYYLLKGENPPKAFDIESASVIKDLLPNGVSEQIKDAIAGAMAKSKFERTPTVGQFLAALTHGVEEKANVNVDFESKVVERTAKTIPLRRVETVASDKRKWRTVFLLMVFAILCCGALAIFIPSGGKNDAPIVKPEDVFDSVDYPIVDSISVTYVGNNKVLSVDNVKYTMVYVHGGEFTMGTTYTKDNDAYSEEVPAHSVMLDSYYMGETEVTQALWKAVMGTTIQQQCAKAHGSIFNQSDLRGVGSDYPMYYISWEECQTFVGRLNYLTGERFHLPTEAQWEYAAEGESVHMLMNELDWNRYKDSGNDELEYVAWYNGNSDDSTHIVKTKHPNVMGLYDMSGNVWEWCQDRFGSYSRDAQTNPTGATTGSRRVIRGGSWCSPARNCRSTNRDSGNPSYRDNYLGFRLAL